MTVLVDPSTAPDEKALPDTAEGHLVGWVMANVDAWRAHRDSNHKTEWDEYYRIWRAKWSEEDRTRKSERSKIITPATMQAVDSTVAELQEAVFGKEAWIDLDEDVKNRMDHEKVQQIIAKRDLLLEKAKKAKVPRNIAKAMLCGSIWGTGIAKVDVQVKTCRRIVRDEAGAPDAQEYEEVSVGVIPLEPYEFIPDPTTDDIDEMLGCAHETVVPLHQVREKIRNGAYFSDVKIDAYNGEDMPQGPKLATQTRPVSGRGVWVVEWHGKVPAKYLLPIIQELPQDVRDGLDEMEEEEELVEAIVTIGNKSTLLGAKKSPFLMQDRSIVSYQHDTIPGYIWGRGVPEKASNSQRTLDATVRARIDAMALVAHPMFAGDVTRLPRGFNLSVFPGKFWPTTGNPGDILQPMSMGQVNPELFSHAQDAERMVSTATGAMDPGAGYAANDQSATNTALNSSAFIKRSKLALKNIQESFLDRIVEKMLWRYMQFSPDEFPQDYEFTVRTSLGIMAREFEQQQLIQLLSVVPNESPVFFAIVKAIFDNSSSPHKGSVLNAIDQLINPPPPSPEEQQEAAEQKALDKRGREAAVAELEAKAKKAEAEAERALAQANKADADAQRESQKLALDNERLDLEHVGVALEMRSTAALEQQNAQTDVANDIRAQTLALNGIKEGVSAEQILSESQKLLDAAKANTIV
jgi:hypothetical protein